MAAIGSLVFCTACGDLLDGSTGDASVMLTCDVCGTQNRDTAERVIKTQSKPDAFPSALRLKRSAVQEVDESTLNVNAVSDTPCEKCGRKQVRYYTQQLRSADEGSTVFYVCDCGHKWTQNN